MISSFQIYKIAILVLILNIGFGQIYPVYYHHKKQDNDNLKELMEQKKIDFVSLPIGYIPYGKTLKAEAFVSKPYDSCSLQSDIENLKPIMIADSLRQPGCNWTEKARFAQEQGVQLLILVESTNADIQKTHYIENSYYTVNIPVIIVDKRNGQKLKQVVEEVEHLSFAINYGHPPQKSTVKVEYWMHAVDYTHHSFLVNFKPLYELLKQDKHTKIEFHPRIPVIQNQNSKKLGFKQKHIDCLSGGRYCLNSSSHISYRYNKQQSLLIDLGGMCVFQQNLESWFEATDKFFMHCIANNYKRQSDLYPCFKLTIQDIESIDKEKYQDCMNNGQEDFDIFVDDHDLLRKEYEHQINIQQNKSPELLVNGLRIQGDIQSQHDIYAGVCSAYSEKSYPKFCEQYLGYTPKDFDEDILQEHKNRKVGLIIFLVSLGTILSFVFFYGLVKYLKRQHQIRLHLRVNEVTQQSYLNLDSNNKA